LGYILYKTELLNDIIQSLIPDFDIKNVSDECLEVYNNYIGNYDKYLDEINYVENSKNDIKEKKFLIFYSSNKDIISTEYKTLYNNFQYPYYSYHSSSINSIDKLTNNRKKQQKCLHEYLVLNENEDEQLNKTIDTILKLESIKNQR